MYLFITQNVNLFLCFIDVCNFFVRKSHKHRSRSRHRRSSGSSSEDSSEVEEPVPNKSDVEIISESSRHRTSASEVSKTSALSKVQQSAAALVAAAAAALSEDDSDDDLDIVDDLLESSAKETKLVDSFSSKSSNDRIIAASQIDGRGVHINKNGDLQSLTINVTNEKVGRQVCI